MKKSGQYLQPIHQHQRQKSVNIIATLMDYRGGKVTYARGSCHGVGREAYDKRLWVEHIGREGGREGRLDTKELRQICFLPVYVNRETEEKGARKC